MRVPRYLLAVLALAGAYYLLARFSLQTGVLPGNVSPVWPPAGLAIATVLLAGPRLLPGVFLGELLANATSGLPVWVAACMAAGNVLEAGAAWWFGVRREQFTRRLDSMDQVLRYLLLAGVVSTALSATVGVSSLAAAGVVPLAAAKHAWLTWWLGDALGAVIVGATLLVCWGAGRPRRRQLVEIGVGFTGLLATCAFVFHSRDGFPYLVFPFVVWAALRFAQRGATSAMLLVTLVAVVGTSHRDGPFALRGTASEQLWLLDVFLVVVAATALALASVVTERDGARTRLAALNASLEQRVAERTEALQSESSKLAEAQRVGHVGSFDWDVPAGLLSWSAEHYLLFGVEPVSFLPTYDGYLQLLHPEDRPAMASAVDACLTDHEPFEIHYRIRRPDGELRWMSSRGQVAVEEGVVVRMSGTAQDITAFVQLHDELEHRALHDPLTGLPNRTRFEDLLTRALEDHRDHRRHADGELAVLFVDVDRFKSINDSLGHEAGDQVLRAIATRLRESLREDGVVARFGGDEFVVLCQHLAAPSEASAIARRLLLALSEPFSLSGKYIPLSASIGVAFGTDRTSGDAVLRDADAAMYRAKELGGASVADCIPRQEVRSLSSTDSSSSYGPTR